MKKSHLFKTNDLVLIIAFIELMLGAITLLGLLIYSLLSILDKPCNVFVFVFISSLIALITGIGLINRKDWARKTLLFFAGYVILTKVMIFLNLLHFSGEIITFMPLSVKDFISIVYHGLVIIILNQKNAKEIFIK